MASTGDITEFNTKKAMHMEAHKKAVESLQAEHSTFVSASINIINELYNLPVVTKYFTLNHAIHDEITRFTDDCNVLTTIIQSFTEKANLLQKVIIHRAESEKDLDGGKKKAKANKKTVPKARKGR